MYLGRYALNNMTSKEHCQVLDQIFEKQTSFLCKLKSDLAYS